MDNLDSTNNLFQQSVALESAVNYYDDVANLFLEINSANNRQKLEARTKLLTVDRDYYFDRLTGLPTYDLLVKHIIKSISIAREQPDFIFAVLFLDLDRFKSINNSFGRILGDRLLIAISQKLTACLRSQDFIARIGSDEFAILLNNIKNVDYATNIAERIYREFIIPFNLNGCDIFVEASIGIAIGHKDYQQPEDLLRDAELAVADAKKYNRTCYQVFDRSMHGGAVARLQLESDLRWAIKRQELLLYYQPIVSLIDNQINGFEVLIRWQHPVHGLVSPAKFIPIAEETGLILALGSWVLSEACQQMRIWQTQFKEIAHWKISINISSKQLVQSDFAQQVKQILQETKLDPHNLKLEITESSLVENTQHTLAIFQELKSLGVQFSLDDFGTGYSSLSYLYQFPFDTIKIDRSFISNIDSNSEKLRIVRSIITLARSLGMDTIAEGIESFEQSAQLKALKCQHGQGYLLFRPLNRTALEAFIVNELTNNVQKNVDNYRALLEEQISKDTLFSQIERLQHELEDLKQEKVDLEIMLETTTEHADLIQFQLHQEIDERQKAENALQQANQTLEKLSVIDSLTQIANRRRFDDYLLAEWQKLQIEKDPLSLILCDIDYFKLYNDKYGHLIGDYCLQQVALAIEGVVQKYSGLLARYGGEEFGIILPDTSGMDAFEIAKEIRAAVHNLKIAHQKSTVDKYVTLSLGIYSMIPTVDTSPDLLIALADKALYEAKDLGRNRAYLLNFGSFKE
ncbi:diguanylate cyclase domain-containing protein [Myxosarcina sp. GI1]|uniref:diguanylate cyclase domain-containing protein n=1 Tax=Myxosarcina sp. GI1 TaxID=1541065 RepID=UPI00068FCBC1|nr:diguanylate cyclase [Myxosarcina sp. GI1]